MGKAYSNRSDLTGAKLGVRTPTGLPYGKAKELADQQKALPMGPPPPIPAALRSVQPTATPGATAPAPGATAPTPGAPDPAAQADRLRATMAGLPGLLDDTQRPDEPLTNGVDHGPGQGSEALAAPAGPDPDLVAMAPYLPALELMVSQPGTSASTRNFVRRIRGAMPRGAQ